MHCSTDAQCARQPWLSTARFPSMSCSDSAFIYFHPCTVNFGQAHRSLLCLMQYVIVVLCLSDCPAIVDVAASQSVSHCTSRARSVNQSLSLLVRTFADSRLQAINQSISVCGHHLVGAVIIPKLMNSVYSVLCIVCSLMVIRLIESVCVCTFHADAINTSITPIVTHKQLTVGSSNLS